LRESGCEEHLIKIKMYEVEIDNLRKIILEKERSFHEVRKAGYLRS
jgi:hypothetical protein